LLGLAQVGHTLGLARGRKSWAANGRAQEGGCGHLLARPSAPAWARARRTREWTRGMPGPTGLGREGGWGRWWAGWAKK